MKIKPYNIKEHKEMLLQAMNARQLNSPLFIETLPEFGLVLTEHDTFIAAGFLRKVEGNYAILDGLITNPSISPFIRNSTLDRLVSKLIKIAKHNKIKALIGFSLDNHTIIRSGRHGFTKNDHTVIALDLTSGQGA